MFLSDAHFVITSYVIGPRKHIRCNAKALGDLGESPFVACHLTSVIQGQRFCKAARDL